jgi:hypothetical protein
MLALRDWACGINQPERYPREVKPLAERLRERLEARGREIAEGVTRWVG